MLYINLYMLIPAECYPNPKVTSRVILVDITLRKKIKLLKEQRNSFYPKQMSSPKSY